MAEAQAALQAEIDAAAAEEEGEGEGESGPLPGTEEPTAETAETEEQTAETAPSEEAPAQEESWIIRKSNQNSALSVCSDHFIVQLFCIFHVCIL